MTTPTTSTHPSHSGQAVEPAAAVEARSIADIRSAVLQARRRGLPVAVRSTGHGSLVSPDGAMLISTSSMTGVDLDPDRRIARVRPGARWSDVIAAAELYGLAPMSGDTPSVGVVGYTFGGGVGWLARPYGYGADNLVSAQLVTADGELVRAAAEEHPDLYWAIRGGGGNFGIATELEIRLAPVSRVIAGVAYADIDRAAEALQWFGDHAAELPSTFTVAPRLLRTSPLPQHAGPVLAVGAVYAGDLDSAATAFSGLHAMIGAPLYDDFAVRRYSGIAVPGTRPQGFEMYRELSDGLIKTAVDSVIDEDGGNALEFRHWGGATAQPAPGAGPVGHRDVPFSIKIDGGPEVVAALAPTATGGKFLNFLADPTQTRRAYRMHDWYRLREVKRRWDPDNIFRINHNIPPA
ncbi:FAD-binding oxidoreductase [Microlunatus sp. Gsoil 973]|uniref:FAD-binding oxidoreductase n=1 Tax=Microlunatus sp. Gsoil 973 TaxID=2672569 RepID=UPI0018A84368|nr:FAD-binding oxidoreductase [Microlunatus sp. Gsoil 973]